MLTKHLLDPKQFEQIEPGWKNLITDFLQEYDKLVTETQTISTLKEKFGTLRIYTEDTSDKVQKLIEKTEDASENICGECGSQKNCERHQIKNLVRTLCKTCALKMDPSGKSNELPRKLFKAN